MSEGRFWLAVRSHVHAEERAALNLKRQDFDVYLPRFARKRRHARRVETVSRPLFPRYLFVAVVPELTRWRSIQSTVGVCHLIGHRGAPAPVNDTIIAAIRAREDESGHVVLEETPPWRPGDKVRIRAGVFADCSGLFAGRDRDRVSILLDLLGRKVPVSVDPVLVDAA